MSEITKVLSLEEFHDLLDQLRDKYPDLHIRKIVSPGKYVRGEWTFDVSHLVEEEPKK